jgi:hypothetical protein
MTTSSRSRADLERLDTAPPHPPAPLPMLSHGTQVEQARAVAQVQAAALMARQFPRDESQAVLRMRSATDRVELARVGFYRYNRGGTQINELTIHVARELARCWGNIDYGVVEISRDPVAKQSEMLAYAWDMETNARSATTFIVPWVRDANGRLVPIDSPRDVYENNANVGARRLREMIKSVMPGWLFDEAKERLKGVAQRQQANVPIETQRVNAIEKFATLGVLRRQLEDKLSRKADDWTAQDMFDLSVIFQSLQQRETTVEEEFGARVSRSRASLDPQPDRAAEEAAEPDPFETPMDGGTPSSPPVESTQAADPAHADTVATPSAGEVAAQVSAWFERNGLAGASPPRRMRRDWIVREVLGVAGEEFGVADLTEESSRELLTRLGSLSRADLERYGATPRDQAGDDA